MLMSCLYAYILNYITSKIRIRHLANKVNRTLIKILTVFCSTVELYRQGTKYNNFYKKTCNICYLICYNTV